MIYDEGFDIIFNKNKSEKNDRSYFSFSHYGKNNYKNKKVKSKWVSFCFSTLIGWYHVGDSWGCFYGTKEGHDKNEVTNGETKIKLKVVEGKIISKESSDDSTLIAKSFFQKNMSHSEKEYDKNKIKNNSKQKQIISQKNKLNFIQTKSDLLHSKKSYDFSKLAEKINTSNLLWKAHNYQQSEGVSNFNYYRFNEIGKYYNLNSNKSKFSKYHPSKNNYKLSLESKVSSKNADKIKYPKNFSWMNLMSKPRSQVYLQINIRVIAVLAM
jgi:hypothetical protein